LGIGLGPGLILTWEVFVKDFVLVVAVFLICLSSCSTSAPLTTQEKIDQIGAIISQRMQEKENRLITDMRKDIMAGKRVDRLPPPVTKDEIISVLGRPLKTQMFLGALYMLYETKDKQLYVFVVNESQSDAGYRKVEPNDPKLKDIFNAKVDAYGFPPGTHSLESESVNQRPAEARQPETPVDARLVAQEYYIKGISSKDRTKALEYFNKALELDPQNRSTYLARAEEYYGRGDYVRAFRDFDQVLGLNPEPSDYKSIAWHLVTCKDPKYRDAKKGVMYAEKAFKTLCGPSLLKLDNNCAEYLHVLAVAKAEGGDFLNAEAAEKLIKKSYYPLNDAEEKKKKEFEKSLEAFKYKRTYLEAFQNDQNGNPGDAGLK
jgi:tetratricopeptide (TPR) repeat protein